MFMERTYPSNVRAGIEENRVVVLIIPDEQYTQKLLGITREVVEVSNSALYVSLNRPYQTLAESFSAAGIDASKLSYVDAVTQTASKAEDSGDNVKYVSSPGALTELSLTIAKILDTKKHDFLLFDSLSTLLVYENEMVVTRFIHSLMSKLRVLNCKGVFTCLKRDVDSVVIKDLNMFADMILDTETWGI